MEIYCSKLYETQLKDILQELAKIDIISTKKFKSYLDTIIVNVPTKAAKYKKSIYCDDNNIKDIEYKNYTIILYINADKLNYLILSIIKKT